MAMHITCHVYLALSSIEMYSRKRKSLKNMSDTGTAIWLSYLTTL